MKDMIEGEGGRKIKMIYGEKDEEKNKDVVMKKFMEKM